MRVNSLIVVLALLLPLFGCLDGVRGVRNYQEKATKACEAHHSPEECKPLPYPSEPE